VIYGLVVAMMVLLALHLGLGWFRDPWPTSARTRAVATRSRARIISSAVAVTNAGKDVHVRVKRVDNAEVTMIRSWSAHERVTVRRAMGKETTQ
jgi:hypothetical protein